MNITEGLTMKGKWLIGILLATASIAFAQNGAHEHGAANVSVAIDGEKLLIEFSGALDNVVGFEHAPRTEVERDTFSHAISVLEQPDELFLLADAARCKVTDKRIDMPYRDNGEPEREHADFQATYQFECAAPSSLQELQVNVFDLFPRIRNIRALVATSEAQNAVALDRASRKLPL